MQLNKVSGFDRTTKKVVKSRKTHRRRALRSRNWTTSTGKYSKKETYK